MSESAQDDRQTLEEEQDRLERKWRSPRRFDRLMQDLFWPRPEPPDSMPLSKPEIRMELGQRTLNEKEVEALLAEARAIYDTRDARLARIETRATTLQATVGIATALMLASASVVLDSNKVSPPDGATSSQ